MRGVFLGICLLVVAAPLAAAEAPAIAQRVGNAWTDAANPVVKAFEGGRLGLWSLRTPAPAAIPAVKRADWCRTPVDRFILAKLEHAGLAPSAEADRRTLLRRLSFDLIGLPPTPEELARFESDVSPDAYEREVDRLLNSPHHGVRAAQFWLDLVRYSDSNGFERDEFRPVMWRFRDYVVRSLNADKPFDRFIHEQLAGDELAAMAAPEHQAELLVATGFLHLGPYDTTAEIFEENERARDQLLADLANTTGTAFLGLTFSCCRCHDHKYDPLLHEDHFRLRAFFAAVELKRDLVVDSPAAAQALAAENAVADKQIEACEQERKSLVEVGRARELTDRVAKLPEDVHSLAALAADQRDAAAKAKLAPFEKQLAISDDEAKARLSPEEKKRRDDLKAQIAELKKQRRESSLAWGGRDSGPKAPPTRVFHDGDPLQPGLEVPPGFLSVIDPNPAAIVPPGGNSTGRRLALARWLTSPENPLTARVQVNRLWQRYFGVGLVATSDDFGLAGTPPTHAELLDWLALEFSARGWSLKEMQRLLVTSAVYRQASFGHVAGNEAARGDPENRLLWRQNPRRLDAEALRDALLFTSGELRTELAGSPRWPEVPRDILLGLPVFLEDMQGRLEDWYTDPEDKTLTRSLFLVHKRCLPIPFLEAFDFPDTSVSCTRRGQTTMAPQALALLNSPFAVDRVKAFATRVEREAGSDLDARIMRAVQLALGRPPSAAEREACRAALARGSLVEMCRALLNTNEFVYVD